MSEVLEYINPALAVLIPVLYLVGMGIKHAKAVDNRWIPLLLGGVGIILALVWVLATGEITTAQEGLQAVFTAVVQGVLCAGSAVYANQIVKQAKGD